MDWPFAVAALVLVVAGIAGGWWFGWKSAHAYLESAQAILQITQADAEKSIALGARLDKLAAEVAGCVESGGKLTREVTVHLIQIDDSVRGLFEIFQRAGFGGRPATAKPGPQRGERPRGEGSES